MPMFEYRCTRCGHEFEELVFGDKTPVCPACHAEATEKLISKPCRHCEGSGMGDFAPSAAPASGGGCAGCSGGNCARADARDRRPSAAPCSVPHAAPLAR